MFRFMHLSFAVALPALFAFAATAEVEVWLSSEDGRYALASVPAIPLSEAEETRLDVIEIDPARAHQSILGMGASFEHATCHNLALLSEEAREEVIRRLVHPEDGIGMNLMRLCIGASDFIGEPYYSYNDLPPGETGPELEGFSVAKDRDYVLPVVRAALRINPGVLYFASPWSPPGWMKSTGKMEGGTLLREHYDVYARYLLKFVQAYEAEGVPIHALTLQNEPGMVSPDYPTCLWKGEWQRDFIRDHVGPLFEREGVDAQIWCWDHNYNNLDFPRAVLSDPEAARYVQGTAFHFYEGKPEAMAQLKSEFPDKDIFFTEGSTFKTRGALQIIGMFRNGARSYNAWVILLDENRKPNRGPHFASPTAIEINSATRELTYRYDYYMYGQFMKFIGRGAVRLESTPGDRQFDSIAFRNPDGAFVLVAANNSDRSKRFAVQCGDRFFRASLPPKAVATYRWR